MDEAWAEMKQSISLANRLNKTDDEVAEFHAELKTALHSAVSRCRVERKRKLAEAPKLDLSDECLRRAARFTDHLPLANYAKILHLVPRLVNVVTCAPACTPHARFMAPGTWRSTSNHSTTPYATASHISSSRHTTHWSPQSW
jgi:hypothetical protein